MSRVSQGISIREEKALTRMDTMGKGTDSRTAMAEQAGSERSLGDIIRDALATAPLQLLHECMTGAQTRKKPRGTTEVKFLTQNMTPNDLMWFAGALGRSESRKPKHIGIVVWVPTPIYEGLSPSAREAPSDGRVCLAGVYALHVQRGALAARERPHSDGGRLQAVRGVLGSAAVLRARARRHLAAGKPEGYSVVVVSA